MSQIRERLIWRHLIACLALGCANIIAIQAQSRLERKQHVKRVKSQAKISASSSSPTRFRLTRIRARKGDNLAAIASAHRLPIDELARLNGIAPDAKLRPGQEIRLPAWAPPPSNGEAVGKRIQFSDGTAIDVDEAWKQGEDFWYRVGSITAQIDRPVRSIDPIRAQPRKELQESAASPTAVDKSKPAEAQSLWIVLQGGARMRVDEVSHTDTGVWYRRGNLSIFLERQRIARIESEFAGSKPAGWRERGWTSGNTRIDELIRANGTRFGVDPYLVFCVIEKESHFHTRVVSPKGARGLMQLMPATANRFGVRRPFDPAENIFGGTQYLKELLEMFHGRLDLALAGYNAGEAAVLRSGRNVPRYPETRDYVRKITRRYGAETAERVLPSPQ